MENIHLHKNTKNTQGRPGIPEKSESIFGKISI